MRHPRTRVVMRRGTSRLFRPREAQRIGFLTGTDLKVPSLRRIYISSSSLQSQLRPSYPRLRRFDA